MSRRSIPNKRKKLVSNKTYDKIDDMIYKLYTSIPKPSRAEIRKQVPEADMGRMMRAIWRAKLAGINIHSHVRNPRQRKTPKPDDSNKDAKTIQDAIQSFSKELYSNREVKSISISVSTLYDTFSVTLSHNPS